MKSPVSDQSLPVELLEELPEAVQECFDGISEQGEDIPLLSPAI